MHALIRRSLIQPVSTIRFAARHLFVALLLLAVIVSALELGRKIRQELRRSAAEAAVQMYRAPGMTTAR